MANESGKQVERAAYVEFKNVADANRCLDDLNGTQFYDRYMVLSLQEPRMGIDQNDRPEEGIGPDKTGNKGLNGQIEHRDQPLMIEENKEEEKKQESNIEDEFQIIASFPNQDSSGSKQGN